LKKLGSYFKLARDTKYSRRWYKADLREFGIKWKGKGPGFIALDGSVFYKTINYSELLR